MRVNDAIAGALVLAFGLGLVAMSWGFQAIPGQPYGAATFPLLIGGGFGLTGLALIAKGVAGWRSLPGIDISDWGRSPVAIFRIVLTIALVILYIAFSERLGFILGSFLLLTTLFFALRVNPLVAISVAVVATVAIQQAFGVLLRVPLPRSDIFAFLW